MDEENVLVVAFETAQELMGQVSGHRRDDSLRLLERDLELRGVPGPDSQRRNFDDHDGLRINARSLDS